MIVTQITLILMLLLKAFSVYFLITALFALKRRREYPEAAPRCRFAVVIAARNEERVVGALVQSLFAQDYPRELFDVYVVPNNCTDDTEGAARAAGARILRCLGPVRRKGDALREAFDQLMPRGGYDAYCVFDADNVADRRFLREMNNAFCAGARVVKGRNEVKNPYDSWVAGSYGVYFGLFNLFYNRARAACGLSAKLVGTAFAVSHSLLVDLGGWNTHTIAEDAEFASQCALLGERVWWAPRAVAYDEAPNSFRVSLRQRRRWCSGLMQVGALGLPPLLRRFAEGKRLLTLDFILFLLSPFVQAVSVVPFLLTLLSAAAEGGQAVLSFLWLAPAWLLTYYIGMASLAAVVSRAGGRRGRAVLKTALGFPLFMASWLPLQLTALLKKTETWEEIRHERALALEEVP